MFEREGEKKSKKREAGFFFFNTGETEYEI